MGHRAVIYKTLLTSLHILLSSDGPPSSAFLRQPDGAHFRFHLVHVVCRQRLHRDDKLVVLVLREEAVEVVVFQVCLHADRLLFCCE